MFYFPLKFKMAAISGEKLKFFSLCIGYSNTTLWVKNLLEITLSLTVFEIFLIFHIFTKSSKKKYPILTCTLSNKCETSICYSSQKSR